MTQAAERELLMLIGDPSEIKTQIEAFTRSADWLASHRARLVEAHDHQWIAIYNCELRCTAPTLGEILAAVDAAGLPRGEVVIEFVEAAPLPLIV